MAKGKMLTDAALKKMKPGDNATDSLPGRGSGSIYFECRESGSVTAYYRYRHEGRTKKSRIGFYTNKAHSAGYSLTEIREQARQLARIAAEHGDVGCYLEEQAAAAEAERARRQRQAEIEASRGSFGELLDSYADSLEQSGKVSAGKYDSCSRRMSKTTTPNSQHGLPLKSSRKIYS
ncbi:Arm DNA-binding domain-containing protein [Azotobacter sp. CWF10]